jgi:hypothetical protein
VFSYLISELSKKKIAFIELKDDNDPEDFYKYGYPSSKSVIPDIYSTLGKLFNGTIVGNNEYNG